MGNAYRKSSQDTLDFIKKENSKWSRIITSIQNVPDMPWDEYIEKEMRSTEEQLDRLRGKHGYQTPNAILAHEEELNRQSNRLSQLSSDMDRLFLRNQYLETRYKDMSKFTADLERENIDLIKRLQYANGHPQNNSNLGQMSQGNHNKDEQRSKEVKEQQIARQQKGKMEMTKDDQLKMQDNNQLLSAINGSLETRVKELEKEIKSFELVLGKVREEKDVLLLRLNKYAGDRQTENNPAISDLSDVNRPTKLAEFYSELYDNEWTDAFEALRQAGYEERVAVETLRLTFLSIMQYCESKANHMMQKSTDAVNFLFGDTGRTSPEMKGPSHATLPQKQAKEMGVLFREKSSIENVIFQQRWLPILRRNARYGKSSSDKIEKKTKIDNVCRLLLSKDMAIHIVPIVQKAYMETNWSKEYIQELKPYILNCIFMSWMMLVQSPPMSLHKLPGDKEVRFDKNIYKEYITSGPRISYVVWPALLLNEGGSLLCKGVAEGKQPSN